MSDFKGGLLDYALRIIVGTILTVITFGIMYPWTVCLIITLGIYGFWVFIKLRQWKIRHTTMVS